MSDITLEYSEFVELLAKMVAHTEFLQNDPPTHVPKEKLIADIVISELEGCRNITIEKVEYVEGRPNLIIRYANYVSDSNLDHNNNNNNNKTIGFIGSHMDVVPADVAKWTYDPFKLTIPPDDSDKLYGRGTTDCLGHVALLTLMLKKFSENDVKLNTLLAVVFIANEESHTDSLVGIGHVASDGKLDFLKNGPVYWVDASDVNPNIGSGTGIGWSLKVSGKSGHSGVLTGTINPVLAAMSISIGLIEEFNKHFPEHPKEKAYNFPISSNMKPTVMMSTENSVNQIANTAIVKGDIRAVPFYDAKQIQTILNEYIDRLNNDLSLIPSLHKNFSYVSENGQCLKIELEWMGEPSEGVACDIESVGFKMLENATKKVTGICNVVSCLGSLPLVKNLMDQGFDLQIIGYGNGASYHADNEYCTFSGMKIGFDIMSHISQIY